MRRILPFHITRALLVLALALTVPVMAGAADFITDVMLIGGNKSETDNLKATLQGNGWHLIEKDLNAGASGDYIFLLYKTADNTDGYNPGYISGFYLSDSRDFHGEEHFEGRTYTLVPYDGGDHFKKVQGDLNSKANGADIHLFYTRDLFPGNRAVTSISFDDSDTDALGANGSNTGYDLNNSSGGEYIYMHYTTATLSGCLTRIGNGDLSDNYVPFYSVGSRSNYCLTQQIYTAEEIGLDGEITSFGFENTESSPFTRSGVRIYMKMVDKEQFASDTDIVPVGEEDLVFEGDFEAGGYEWGMVDLISPFSYDGNSNLLICCYDPSAEKTWGSFTHHSTGRNRCLALSSETEAPGLNDVSPFTGTKLLRTYNNDLLLKIRTAGNTRPTNIVVSTCNQESATLNWTAPVGTDTPNGYLYQYKRAEDTDWSAEVSSSGTSASLVGLQAFTDYDFRVKAVFSGYTSPFAVLHFKSAAALPYDYGFENGWDGWWCADINWQYTGINELAAYEGSCGFYFWSDGVTQYLYSPLLPDTTPLQVSFYCKARHKNYNERFHLGYSTTTNDIINFTWFEEVVVTADDWVLYEKDVPRGTKYIGIKYPGQESYVLFLDDFHIEDKSTYKKPSDLAVSSLTDRSATLTWTAPESSVTGYSYQYRKFNENAWSSSATVNTPTVTLENLEANTTYHFRVKALYGNSFFASNHTTTIFMTEGETLDIPFSDSFENGMGGWRIVDGVIGTEVRSEEWNVHSGEKGFNFSNSLNPQYLFSPRINASSDFVVSFFYDKAPYGSEDASFRVGYSTSTKDLSAISWVDELHAGNTWEQYTGSFPADTKYVVIQWIDGNILGVDDFIFAKALTTLPAVQATFDGKQKYVATFYDGTVNYKLPAGAVAYTVVLEGTKALFVRIGNGDSDVIPADTPVVIVADSDALFLTPVSAPGVTAREGNSLLGADTDMPVTNGKIGEKTVYVLGIKNGILDFYPFSGSTIPAGKAYILN